ncbi:HypC/HybG/HupF family hydrogenase formation chaperone [Bacteroidota bacterium]
MCLSIPGKVISVEGNMAKVSVGGAEYNASLQLIEDVNPGDYVLVHTGFAIQKISKEDADETMKLLSELADVHNRIEQEEAEKIKNKK